VVVSSEISRKCPLAKHSKESKTLIFHNEMEFTNCLMYVLGVKLHLCYRINNPLKGVRRAYFPTIFSKNGKSDLGVKEKVLRVFEESE